jgi:23S rRNA pseudouridine955/2504/2580 synthase
MESTTRNKVREYIVTEGDELQRLDNLLIKILKNIPKSHIYRIIRSGEVRINKKRAKPENKVTLNDIIRIPPINNLVEEKINNFIPTENFVTLYEDEYYLIINKPSKIACHGGSGVNYGIIEQMRKTRTNLKFLELAHRLDRDTSGILILAKKRLALTKIQELIKTRQLKKNYLALVCGFIKENKKIIKLPLYKYNTKEGERRVRVDHNNGVEAETIITLVEKFDKFTLLKANIKTGRTHQIRVHLQSIGHPIIMDDKYGLESENKYSQQLGLKRMFLHAYEIEFIHPFSHNIINIKCELPEELTLFIHKIKIKNN